MSFVLGFGCCSYRKLKVTVEVRRKVCPICQHELERLRYVGGNSEILACYGSSRRAGEKLDFLAVLHVHSSSFRFSSYV